MEGSEFYMLSESVQINGQIPVAIFTHQRISPTLRDVLYRALGAAGHYGQLAQRGNPISERRVGAEQRGQSAAAKPRFYDT